MNTWKKMLLITGSILALAGCSEKETAARKGLSESDESLITIITQAKPFSVYQLQNVGKKEAEQAVTEKLNLKIPDFLEAIEALTIQHLEADEGLILDAAFYSVSSQEREATYSTAVVMKNEEGLYPIYSNSQIDYAYNAEKGTVYMDIYKLEVINSGATEKYNGGDLQEYIMKLGEQAGISEEDIAGEVELLMAKSEEELKNQYIVLYDTFEKAKEKGVLGKRLRIAYGEKGIPVKIQLYLKDYYS
ncbi:hypothetical protein I6N96_09380 [Enterococcus sp. BWM-S5]|uniref:Lipoprotein n=1 Tax=Enterococcus larvae TaxID=2794352 RepID=A0ABS4CK51_9ENTE|nr:hypothetical protein [Enterococcus larvae]MBP1046496.1 hypothetical protein [Enterococcus larvae]